jgi:hypothetical protein
VRSDCADIMDRIGIFSIIALLDGLCEIANFIIGDLARNLFNSLLLLGCNIEYCT